MAAVRASTRVSIAWKGNPAYEDTDTLVLTIHDFSLDLRVFISGSQKGQIDWSTVAKVSELEGSTSERPILRWEHLIDSRPDTGVEDQGSFDTLPNGDVTETGRMSNPATGQIEPYVETWRRFTMEPCAPYCVLERVRDKLDDNILYLGRVGDHDLTCGQTPSGGYVARRGYKGVQIFGFGGDGTSELPEIPRPIPQHWRAGEVVELGHMRFMLRQIGLSHA